MKKLSVWDNMWSTSVDTKATTEKGYINVARRIYPYVGWHRLNIRVMDYNLSGDPVVFDKRIDTIIK